MIERADAGQQRIGSDGAARILGQLSQECDAGFVPGARRASWPSTWQVRI